MWNYKKIWKPLMYPHVIGYLVRIKASHSAQPPAGVQFAFSAHSSR